MPNIQSAVIKKEEEKKKKEEEEKHRKEIKACSSFLEHTIPITTQSIFF